MASRRSRSHADWLGVGRKELCRRVVSRPRRAVSRLRSNNPCRLIPPLPSPYRSDRLVIIHVFLLVDAQVARPPYLHNGARHAVALLKCFFLFFFFLFSINVHLISRVSLSLLFLFEKDARKEFENGSIILANCNSSRSIWGTEIEGCVGRRGKVHFQVQSGVEKCT